MAKDIYLLSAEEQKALKPIIQIMHTVLSMHDVSNTNDADDALNQLMNTEFIALCKKKRLNRQKLMDIAERVMNAKWFCVYLSGGDIDSNGDPVAVWSFVTGDHPEIQKRITQEEYPDFFTIVNRLTEGERKKKDVILAEYRSALGLSEEYKSIDADNVDAVLTVYEIFGDNPRRITVRPLKNHLLMVDKVNALKLWSLTDKSNKKKLFVPYDSVKEKRVGIGLLINFDAVPANLTKSLTRYDQLVYNTVYTLYMSGYQTITASMIYMNMGNNSRPGKDAIQKINDSLTKMGAIRVFIDNSKEREAFPDYPLVRFDEILLDFVRGSIVEVNGSVSESAIKIKTEPCMGRFANNRNQIRSIDIKLLNAPISNSENQLAVKQYLLYLTSYSVKTSMKISHSTFFERVGATDRKQKQRALDAADKVLAYYKDEQWISDYTMEADGILIVKKQETKK